MTNNKDPKNFLFLLPCVCMALLAAVGLFVNQPDLTMIADVAESDQTSQESKGREDANRQTVTTPAVSAEDSASVQKLLVNTDAGFRDGVYTGSAQGFGGTITVRVQVGDGEIRSVNVVSHDGETPAYYAKAKAVIAEILKKQSTDVDTVSGATYSSAGILNAVADALNKAGGKKTAAKTSTVQTDVQSTKTDGTPAKNQTKKIPSGTPRNGVYTGSAVCEKFGYTISCKVRFRDGKAVALYRMKMSGNSDEANVTYMKKAWRGMVRKILKSQTDTADVVSGATYSSNVVLAAYRDAYAKAAGSKTSSDKTSKTTPAPVRLPAALTSKPLPSGTPKDGTYRVSVVCSPDEEEDFEAYTLHADVTFSKGKCTSIKNLGSDAETNRSYYQRAASGKGSEKGVIAQILAAQGADGVYAVSGATCSSSAICELYRKAFALAVGTGNGTGSLSPAPTSQLSVTAAATASPAQQTQTPQISQAPLIPLKNGVYQENAYVYPDDGEEFETYQISAEVVFENNVFTGFRNLVISDTSNQFYMNRALNGTKKKQGLLAQLVGTQGVDADAVTGATCSSHALLELYKKAFREAGGQ